MVANAVAPTARQFGRLACAVVIALAAIAAAKAEPGTTAQRIACAPDAYRLCSNKIPNVGAITACMVAKKSKLSAACRAVF